MGEPRTPNKANLIVGLLAGDPEIFKKVKKTLEGIFGKTDFESGVIEFIHTDYYADEMGDKLKRKFLGFKRILDVDVMYKAKLRTNALERKFAIGLRRTVNIDPGYLDLSKLVLFSTKDYSHRVYIGKGVFAEVTLFFRDKKFNPWPWTYPDYRTEAYIDIFNTVRNIYKDKIGGH